MRQVYVMKGDIAKKIDTRSVSALRSRSRLTLQVGADDDASVVRAALQRGAREGDVAIHVNWALVFGPKPASMVKSAVVLLTPGIPGWELTPEQADLVVTARGRGDDEVE